MKLSLRLSEFDSEIADQSPPSYMTVHRLLRHVSRRYKYNGTEIGIKNALFEIIFGDKTINSFGIFKTITNERNASTVGTMNQIGLPPFQWTSERNGSPVHQLIISLFLLFDLNIIFLLLFIWLLIWVEDNPPCMNYNWNRRIEWIFLRCPNALNCVNSSIHLERLSCFDRSWCFMIWILIVYV